jgi:hypothetical protein
VFPEGSWVHLPTTTAGASSARSRPSSPDPTVWRKSRGPLERIGRGARPRKQRSRGSFWARDACALLCSWTAPRRAVGSRDQAEAIAGARRQPAAAGSGPHGGAGACDRGRRPRKARVIGADGLASCAGPAQPPGPSLGTNQIMMGRTRDAAATRRAGQRQTSVVASWARGCAALCAGPSSAVSTVLWACGHRTRAAAARQG